MAATTFSSPRLLQVLAAFAGALLLVFSAACTAEVQIKQGAIGEYCNGFEHDCRPGLSCVNYVCQGLIDPSICAGVCAKLQQCATDQQNCVAECNNSLSQWGEGPIEAFYTCIVDDLTCEEIQAHEDPPQECYNRLELPAERAERCTYFQESVRNCDSSISTSELRKECRFMARTRSEEVWAWSDECMDRVDDQVCEDIYECLNEVFQIHPPLESGAIGHEP